MLMPHAECLFTNLLYSKHNLSPLHKYVRRTCSMIVYVFPCMPKIAGGLFFLASWGNVGWNWEIVTLTVSFPKALYVWLLLFPFAIPSNIIIVYFQAIQSHLYRGNQNLTNRTVCSSKFPVLYLTCFFGL